MALLGEAGAEGGSLPLAMQHCGSFVVYSEAREGLGPSGWQALEASYVSFESDQVSFYGSGFCTRGKQLSGQPLSSFVAAFL